MSLEADVSDILAHVSEDRADTWGKQAARVAEGIRQSGLSADIAASSQRVEGSILILATMFGVAAEAIASEISKSNVLLGSIAEALLNPKSTAAGETFRRGSRALSQGWLSDAISEFEASIEENKYYPRTHALLGLALLRSGKPDRAVDSFTQGALYAATDEPALSAGLYLLAARTLSEQERDAEAISLLTSAQESIRNCPELVVSYTKLSGDDRGLADALRLAPDLSLVAVATGIPSAPRIAEEVALAPDGPVADARALTDALLTLSLNLDDPLPALGAALPTDPAGTETPAALSEAAEVLSDGESQLERLHELVTVAERRDDWLEGEWKRYAEDFSSREAARYSRESQLYAQWQDVTTQASGRLAALKASRRAALNFFIVGLCWIPVGVILMFTQLGFKDTGAMQIVMIVGAFFFFTGPLIFIVSTWLFVARSSAYSKAQALAAMPVPSFAAPEVFVSDGRARPASAQAREERLRALSTIDSLVARRSYRVRPWSVAEFQEPTGGRVLPNGLVIPR